MMPSLDSLTAEALAELRATLPARAAAFGATQLHADHAARCFTELAQMNEHLDARRIAKRRLAELEARSLAA
jgi:hypothetical protein